MYSGKISGKSDSDNYYLYYYKDEQGSISYDEAVSKRSKLVITDDTPKIIKGVWIDGYGSLDYGEPYWIFYVPKDAILESYNVNLPNSESIPDLEPVE